MAKTKGGQREKTKASRISSSKSSVTNSSKCSSDRLSAQAGRMRNRKKSGAELYKTRHNIGKRSAAGRVTSYRETEVALLFPDGFFRPVVKAELTNSEKEAGGNTAEVCVQTPSKADHVTGESKPKLSSSDSAESVKKKHSPKSSSSGQPPNRSKLSQKTSHGAAGKKKTVHKVTPVERKADEAKKKPTKEAAGSSKETKSSKEKGKSVKGNLKSVKNSQNEDSSQTMHDASKQHVDSESLSVEPRAPRIKRTACLNAGAIMSAMYKDTPVVKKPKLEVSSVHAPSEKLAPKQSPKKQEAEKSQSQKKVVSPKKADTNNCAQSGGGRSTKASHLDISKKVKVKMKAKEKLKPKTRLIKKGRKVKVEKSSEEDSDSEKEEQHVPLWPPPRRMASLNAQAILAACSEDRIKRPRTDATPKASRKRIGKQPKQQKQVTPEEVISENCDKEHLETSSEKTSTSKPGDGEAEPESVVKVTESNSPGTQSLPVSSSSEQSVVSEVLERQDTPTEPALKANVQNQSPDVQIVEVKPPSYSGAVVSRVNVGGYTSHMMPHARQTQGPVAFMPSSSSSFSYAAPSGLGSHGNQARYAGVPVQQPIPPHAPSGYALQHQTQRAYQSAHMAYPHQTGQHGQAMIPSQAQHGTQKMYSQGHQQAQGQHLGHTPYPGHPQTRHRTPMASQSQASFQQQQQQQQQQQPQQQQQQPQQQQQQQQPQQQQQQAHHHHQLAPYQASLTPHSSQNTAVQHSQSYHHHHSYPIQQSHQAPTMPLLGHHAMSSGTIYPGGTPMSVTKPKMEPRCSTHGQRFQVVGPKPEKSLMNYPAMPGVQGQQGSVPNHPHGPSPMGNTCTYPYPHSNHGNSQSDHCQSYMMSSMPIDNSATCTMMSFRHFGSAFTLHSYDEQQQEHTTFGFYQPAGPLIQTMPHDPCCIPEHMAMLVPRPQVKVLVHNTGSYPAANPYAALPNSSQPPIIPSKATSMHHVRSDLKEKSQHALSPTKRAKNAKDLDHGQHEKMVDTGKEGDDGKVFTTLEVASKQSKNIDGRELLAQRTKLTSDSLLLQPIMSESSSKSTDSEDKTRVEEPSVAVSEASLLKTSTADVVSSQSQPSDKQNNLLASGHDNDTQRRMPKDANETESSDHAGKDVIDDQTQATSATTTTTVTTSATQTSSVASTVSTVSVAIAATTTVIDTQAKMSSDRTTVVTCSITSGMEPKKCTAGSATSSQSVPGSSTVATVIKTMATTSRSTTVNSTTVESASTPVKTAVNKKAKAMKACKKGGLLIPTTSSSPSITTAVVTMTTATMTTKTASPEMKETSRKRKHTASSEATAVKVPAAGSSDTVEESSTETSDQAKAKMPNKNTASKKARCSAVSTSSVATSASDVGIGGNVSKESHMEAVPRLSSSASSAVPPNTVAQVIGTAPGLTHTANASAMSGAVVISSPLVSPVRTLPVLSLQSTVQAAASRTVQNKVTSTDTKVTGLMGGAVMSAVTAATGVTASKPAVVTPSSAVTPLFVSSTQKPMMNSKATPTAILPQGTVLLSNTGALNQPILMNAVNNPAQLTPGQLPLVSVTAGQVVMPVFLPAKGLTSTTGAVAVTGVVTSTLTTATASGATGSQMRMPLIQNSFSMTQANIALSGMVPPVFLSIPQPNTMGQTFLQLGGLKPALQQIQLPVVSHQQVIVSQASQDMRAVATNKTDTAAPAQGKKPSEETTEKADAKEASPKSRKKKAPKGGTVENKPKAKTPTKKKASKTKRDSSNNVVTSAVVVSAQTSPTTSQVTAKHQPASTHSFCSIPQVASSVSQVRSSTAPLLGCSSQSLQGQGKTNISHSSDPVKSQTPLEMLQTVALNVKKITEHGKEGASKKAEGGRDSGKPVTKGGPQSGQKIDQNGALDLVILGSASSEKCNSKAKTSNSPSARAKPSTPVKVPSAQSTTTGILMTSPRPTLLHSPPAPLPHGVSSYSPSFVPSMLPVLDKACQSSSAVAYEDLIQDLSLPRQQQNSTPLKGTDSKSDISKADPTTPIDLRKKNVKTCSKVTKSEGSKKSGAKKSKPSTSSKQTTGKPKATVSPAFSTSSANSSLQSSGFQYVAGIQIPVINRVHTLTSSDMKMTSAGMVSGEVNKGQGMENQVVSSTTNQSVGHKKCKGEKATSASDVDRQPEKTTPVKGVLSRGFQLNEVVERLHQANKEMSDNSDRSDGESPPNKQTRPATGNVWPSNADPKASKREVLQQAHCSGLSVGEKSSQVSVMRTGSHHQVNNFKIDGDGDDDDDDDDEDALFIDMDCDPADNKPGVSSSDEVNTFTSPNKVSGTDHDVTVVRDPSGSSNGKPSAPAAIGTAGRADSELVHNDEHLEMCEESDAKQVLARKSDLGGKTDASTKASVNTGEQVNRNLPDCHIPNLVCAVASSSADVDKTRNTGIDTEGKGVISLNTVGIKHRNGGQGQIKALAMVESGQERGNRQALDVIENHSSSTDITSSDHKGEELSLVKHSIDNCADGTNRPLVGDSNLCLTAEKDGNINGVSEKVNKDDDLMSRLPSANDNNVEGIKTQCTDVTADLDSTRTESSSGDTVVDGTSAEQTRDMTANDGAESQRDNSNLINTKTTVVPDCDITGSADVSSAVESITTQPADVPPPAESTTQPADVPPPAESTTTQPADVPPPAESTTQPADVPPPAESTTTQPADVPPPAESTTQPADVPPPAESTPQIADVPPPAESTTTQPADIPTSVESIKTQLTDVPSPVESMATQSADVDLSAECPTTQLAEEQSLGDCSPVQSSHCEAVAENTPVQCETSVKTTTEPPSEYETSVETTTELPSESEMSVETTTEPLAQTVRESTPAQQTEGEATEGTDSAQQAEDKAVGESDPAQQTEGETAVESTLPEPTKVEAAVKTTLAMPTEGEAGVKSTLAQPTDFKAPTESTSRQPSDSVVGSTSTQTTGGEAVVESKPAKPREGVEDTVTTPQNHVSLADNTCLSKDNNDIPQSGDHLNVNNTVVSFFHNGDTNSNCTVQLSEHNTNIGSSTCSLEQDAGKHGIKTQKPEDKATGPEATVHCPLMSSSAKVDTQVSSVAADCSCVAESDDNKALSTDSVLQEGDRSIDGTVVTSLKANVMVKNSPTEHPIFTRVVGVVTDLEADARMGDRATLSNNSLDERSITVECADCPIAASENTDCDVPGSCKYRDVKSSTKTRQTDRANEGTLRQSSASTPVSSGDSVVNTSSQDGTLSTDVMSVCTASSVTTADSKAETINNDCNSETLAGKDNTKLESKHFTGSVAGVGTDFDKRPFMAAEVTGCPKSVACTVNRCMDGEESQQDMKRKEIIMAIDSLVSCGSSVEEIKLTTNSASSGEEIRECRNGTRVENGVREGNGICENVTTTVVCELSGKSKFLNGDRKEGCDGDDDDDEETCDRSLRTKDQVTNADLKLSAETAEARFEEIHHLSVEQAKEMIAKRQVTCPGSCSRLGVMEELKIICENEPVISELSGGSSCFVSSANSFLTSCGDADISVRLGGMKRARSLSPERHEQTSGSTWMSVGENDQSINKTVSAKPGVHCTMDGPCHSASDEQGLGNTKKSSEDNPRRTSPRSQSCASSKKEDTATVDDNPRRTHLTGKRKDDSSSGSPPAKRMLISPKKKDDRRLAAEQKKLSPGARKKEEKLYKPWRWEGQPDVRPVYTQVEGPPVPMTCYPAIRHDDGDLIRVRDCVLVKSGPRKSDIPYVAKIGALFEDPDSREMMMSVLWFYRAEHTETERLPRYIDNEIFASRHRDVIPAVCIDDKCYVLTFNEFCRYHGEQTRIQQCLPPRPAIVPLLDSSELIRKVDHLPPLTASNETVFLCRRVYDVKLKRILKNPQVHIASHSAQ